MRRHDLSGPTLVACALATAALALGAAAGAQEVRADAPGLEALTSGHEADGDTDAFVQQLLAVIAERPGSRAASLALLRLDEVRRRAGSEVRAAARETLSRVIDAGAFAADAPAPRNVMNRDLALGIAAGLHAEAGDWGARDAANAARGIVRRWSVVGPFGRTRSGTHDRAFPPEGLLAGAGGDTSAPLQTRRGPRRWRSVELPPAARALRAAEHLHPADGAAYLLTQLRWDGGATARVRLIATGSVKLWWNGRLVIDADHGDRWEQRTHGFEVTAAEGWQRVLVKVADAGTALSLRAVDARAGGTLAGFEVHPGDGLARSGTARMTTAAAEAAAPSEDASPQDLLAAGVELLEAGGAPQAVAALTRAAAAAPSSPFVAYHLARALERALHLPAARRANDARAQWTRVRELAPAFAPARLRAALRLDEDGKPVESFRALRALSASGAAAPAAHEAAASLARREGWQREERTELEAWRALQPGSAEPLTRLAQLARRQRDARRERSLLTGALERDRSIAWAEERLADLASASGDTAAAREIREALLARRPAAAARLRGLAGTERAAGRLPEAARLLERAATAAGGTPGELVRASALWLERWAAQADASGGKADEEAAGALRAGIAALQKALEAAPERHELRRELAALGAADDPTVEVDALWIPLETVLAEAPADDAYPDAHTLCLLDHMVTQLRGDGSRVDTIHQVFRIAHAAGIQRYHSMSVPGEVLALRTVLPDGTSWEPVRVPGSNEVLMPRLAPGAVIEVAQRLVQPAGEGGLDTGPFYFRDPELSEPYVRSRWDVIAPAHLELARIERNMEPPISRVERGDGAVHTTWELRGSGRVEPEPQMPSRDEIAPWLRMLTAATWEDVAEVHRNRLSGLVRPTPELVAAAREATRGVEGAAARAERLYDFVCEHVRRAGSVWVASEVLAERSGSRLTLLKALCDIAEVPARFALAARNPALAPPIDWHPPRPELFSALLLLIEPPDAAPVWVSDAGRLAPYGYVPLVLRGGAALALDATGGAELLPVPAGPIASEATETRLEVRLHGRDARIDHVNTMAGGRGWNIKEQVELAPAPSLKNFVEGQASQMFPGATVTGFDFPGVADRGAPFRVRYQADVPGFVTERGGAPEIRTGLPPFRLLRSLGGRPDRVFPFVLRMQQMQVDEVRIEPGEGWRVERLPASILERCAIGLYSLRVWEEDGAVHLRRTLVLEPSEVPPDEYPRLLEQLRRIDEAEARRIVLRAAP
jgi:hypothetical protein